MNKMFPVNDYFKVKVGGTVSNPMNLSGLPSVEEGIREGIVVAISEEMTFFGFNTYMFDKSLMDIDLLKDIHKHYSQFVGRKVYWPERSETGAVISDGDEDYAFVKMSAIMAVEPNNIDEETK